ncbi:MAG: TonB-dependent receptor [Bacteroidia bacterium]
MKKSIFLKFALFFLVSLIGFSVFAQPPGGRRGGRKMMPFKDRPAIGMITGAVVDSLQGKPVVYASVALVLTQNDSIVAGALTDEKGRFELTEVRPARYRLRIQSLGYANRFVEKVFINPRNPQRDLGKINILAQGSTLDAVDITAEKSFMEVQLDKKVYNTSSILTAQGGVATDLMENIPSVEVDLDGNISLRGNSNVTILIDGRPSGLTGSSQGAILEQIPASSIEKIEVITNPSARYDADGLTGIINVVLKKNKKLGLNGSFQLGLGSQGTPEASPALLLPNKYNSALNLNYRNSKVNVFASYSYNFRDQFSLGINDRTNFLQTGTTVLSQNRDGRRFGGGSVGRAGIDLFLPKQNTVSFSSTYSNRSRNREEDLIYKLSDEEGNSLEDYARYSTEVDDNKSVDLTAGWDKRYKEEGHILSASANVSLSRGLEEVNFNQENFDGNPVPVPGLNEEDARRSITTIQLDYVRPFKKKFQLELGAKSIIRDLGTDFVASDMDIMSGNFVENKLLSNNFEYLEQVHAAYAIAGKQSERWGWQFGLRAEQALTDAELIQTNETFENDYFNFFPSGFVNYKLSEKSQLQVSYSRRVNRPRTRQLNPFTDYSDPLNLRRGNPFLQPEYINSYELGYTLRAGKLTFAPSAYYRRLNNVISRFKTIDAEGVSTTTYANQNSGDNMGLELILVGQLTKWWSVNMSANGYYTILDASNLEADLSNEGYGYGGRLMSTFTVAKKTNIQLSGFYRGPRPSAQGNIIGFASANIAVQHRFWDNRASVNVQLRDIFDTRQFQFDLVGESFEQLGFRKRESRQLAINFTYRFGKQETSRRRKGRPDGGGDGGDFEVD